MNNPSTLERRYRALLKWYPRSFQRKHGEEMLVCLMDVARADQSRPDLMDVVNLVGNGLALRLRPQVPRSIPTMFYAVRLMYVGAVLEVVTMVIVVVTFGSLKSNILRQHPHVTPAQWHLLIIARIIPLEIGLTIGVFMWLWMAWANGRGHNWARAILVTQFGFSTLSLLNGLKQGSAEYARPDLLSGLTVWLLSAVIVALVYNKRSRVHYKKEMAQFLR